MGPEISTNIGSMLRAMENVVLPAIDADNALAKEQSYLIMVYLRLLADQHDKIFHYRLQEIREYHALVTDILACSRSAGVGTGATGTSAEQLLDLASPMLDLDLPSYEHLADLARDLREMADDVTRDILDRAGSGSNASKRLRELLLKQADAEALRERSWVSKLGADPQPQQLRSLPELLPGNAKGGTAV
jgi:hypothetical protein